VDQRQYCKGIAKRLMHDVPKLEHTLGVRKEYDATGNQGLFAGETNHFFKLGILRGQKPAQRMNRGFDSHNPHA
jgi:hypothetical protein